MTLCKPCKLFKLLKVPLILNSGLGETGWPTDGSSYGDSVPSVENAADQWQKVSVLLELGVLMFAVYEAFDEAWKPDTSGTSSVENTGVFGNPTKL